MTSRDFLLLLALVGAVACDDDGTEPESDAGTRVPDAADASPRGSLDAGIDASMDASVDARAIADAAADAGDGICPPSIELRGPFIVDQQDERALAPALGGNITSGTYYLTKSELVINPQASDDAKADCRQQAPDSARQALRFTAATSTNGNLLVRSLDSDSEDGSEELADYVTSNTYRIDGTLIIIEPSGLACTDTTTSHADGGVEREHEVFVPDTEDDPVTFTATPNSFTLFEVWTADNDTPNCTYVYTFNK